MENALATIAVAKLRGVDNQTIKETLSAFGGVKHRLQFVDEIKGVKFYNDSKSTNILATQKALSGFDNRRSSWLQVVWPWQWVWRIGSRLLQGPKKMVILVQSAERVKRAADKAGVAYGCDWIAEMRPARQHELTRLKEMWFSLSPANASWDMYANFEVRGDLFIDTVAELKE